MKNNLININKNTLNVAIDVLEQIKNKITDATNCHIFLTNNKTTIKVDNGQEGYVVTCQKTGLLERQEVSRYIKTNAEERMHVVEELHKEGKTQTEIARLLMVSQKTISTDIKKIKERRR